MLLELASTFALIVSFCLGNEKFRDRCPMEVRRYESVVIFNPRLSEVQLKEEIKKIEALLEKHKATISGVDTAGKKELAYEFNKQRFGYFVTFNYETDNFEVANELQSVLRIADSVHKFQTHLVKSKTRKFKGNPRRPDNASGSSDDDYFGGDYD